MSVFEQAMPSFRLAATNHNDDLASVAARELGDANRWPELIWLNQLVPPYLTDDERQANERVLLTGSLIRVPAAEATPVDDTSRASVFGRDVRLINKKMQVTATGDLLVAAGVDNLTQQLTHAINTPRGQLRRHPRYGCLIWTLKGTVQGPLLQMLGARYVKETLEADYRVRSVNTVAVTDGDALRITGRAEAIDGGTVDVEGG